MLAAIKRRISGGEVLEYTWNDEIKMKDVFGDPQRVDAPLEGIWQCIFSDMSGFLENYHTLRGDADLRVGEWEHVERSAGECSCERQIDVHVAVPYATRMLPGMPTTTHLVEFHHARRSEKSIELRICSATPDVPYGTDFRIQALVSFNELSNGKTCDVDIKIGINFLRQPFLVTKTLKKKAVHHAREGYAEWFRLAKQLLVKGSSFVLDEYKTRSTNTMSGEGEGEEDIVEEDESGDGIYGGQVSAGLLTSRLYDSAEEDQEESS